MRLQATIATVSLLTGLAVSGQATVIFSDNFNSDAQQYAVPVGVLDPDFNVTTSNVDVVTASGNALCVGLESGSCIDIDGTYFGSPTNVSGAITSVPIAVVAGTQYTLTFDANGSQRNFGGVQGGATSTISVIVTGTGNTNLVNQNVTELSAFIDTGHSYTFTAAATGNVTLAFASQDPSGQDAGILLDNVQIASNTGTPEPVSMFLLGSGLLAVSLIGRKKAVRT